MQGLCGGAASLVRQCHVPSAAGMEFSRGTGDGWVREGRSADHDSEKVTALPAFALESRRLQACPNVERSTQRPPARGGERFLPGYFIGVLPPFGSVGEGGKGGWKTRGEKYKPVTCES